jgi:hypothetical protein
MCSDDIADLLQQIQVASKRKHVHTTGDARVQLQMVQQLEHRLEHEKSRVVKDGSHDIMTNLLLLLESGCAAPVRYVAALVAAACYDCSRCTPGQSRSSILQRFAVRQESCRVAHLSCIMPRCPPDSCHIRVVGNVVRLKGCDWQMQVRASCLRCLDAVFAADPVRATLAHGTLRNMLSDALKSGAALDGPGVLGLLEPFALHAKQCALPCGSCSQPPACLDAEMMCSGSTCAAGRKL